MWRSSWPSSADHQLRAIRATSVQWNSRVGRSQTASFVECGSAACAAGSSVVLFTVEVVTGLAGLAQVALRCPDRGQVGPLRGSVEGLSSRLQVARLGRKVLRLLPDF